MSHSTTENTPPTSPKAPQKLPRALGWLLFAAIIILIPLWLTLDQDTDFYRPHTPLQCENPPASQTPFRFIAFGDWGAGTPFQRTLAGEMAKLYQKKPFPVALLLGDNIYPYGDVKQYGKAYFEEPYAPLIRGGVSFYPTIGNHDERRGHLKDQMAYFKMPNQYYKVSRGPVDIFVLNTTYFVRSPAQQAWIKKSLAESKARWKIVMAHHPLYSSGRHGPTEGLKAILEPLLIHYKVDLYLCGHDHDYERFQKTEGVQYIISGGGGAHLTDFRKILPNSQVRIRAHHFLFVEILGEDIWIKAISRYGDIIDCLHWRKALSTQQAG